MLRAVSVHWVVAVGVAVCFGFETPVQAQTKAERSLHKCQRIMQTEGRKYSASVRKVVGHCLQKVADGVLRGGAVASEVERAVSYCVGQFYQLGRTDGRSLSDRATQRMAAACDPAGNAHGADDLLGTGVPGVSQSMEAALRLSGLCEGLGGGAATVSEVLGCAMAGAACQGRQQAAVSFPRAVEWLELLVDAMALRTDARSVAARGAAQAALAAIDGVPAGDGLADIACGVCTIANDPTECEADLTVCNADLMACAADLTVCDSDLATCESDLAEVSECGNGVVDAGEDCDLGDLAGATCVSMGRSGGVLRCGGGCVYDTSECYSIRFVDNGNGTITDNETMLMWEKKAKLDSTPDWDDLHDVDNSYLWAGTCSVATSKLCQPDSAASAACYAGVEGDSTGCDECGDGEGSCTVAPSGTIWQWLNDLNATSFGGYNDWRVPQRQELVTIVDYARHNGPAVNVRFHQFQFCFTGSGCTDVTTVGCACTRANFYWSASTYMHGAINAWDVSFGDGIVGALHKTTHTYVRAVRGGS